MLVSSSRAARRADAGHEPGRHAHSEHRGHQPGGAGDGQVVPAQQLRCPGQHPGPVLRPPRRARRGRPRAAGRAARAGPGEDPVLGDPRRRRRAHIGDLAARPCRSPAPRTGPRHSPRSRPDHRPRSRPGHRPAASSNPAPRAAYRACGPRSAATTPGRLAVGRVRGRRLARGRRVLLQPPSSSAICAAMRLRLASPARRSPHAARRSPPAARDQHRQLPPRRTETARTPAHDRHQPARSSRHTERGDHPSSPPRRPAQLRVTDASPRNQGSRPSRERGREVAARSLRRCILINPPIPLRAAELCSHDG